MFGCQNRGLSTTNFEKVPEIKKMAELARRLPYFLCRDTLAVRLTRPGVNGFSLGSSVGPLFFARRGGKAPRCQVIEAFDEKPIVEEGRGSPSLIPRDLVALDDFILLA